MAVAKPAPVDCAQVGEDPAALLRSLDSLRTAITIFDRQGCLLYANAHLNYLFRSFPPHDSLIGRPYEELIRLEIEGGEIASSALSAEAFAFYDADDRLILGNELYANLCGVKALDELIGRTFPEICARVAYAGRMVFDETPEKWLERRLQTHRSSAGAVTLRTNT